MGTDSRKSGAAVIDPESEIPVYWQFAALRFLLNARLHTEDADEVVRTWFEQAGRGDERYLRWSMKQWQMIDPMSATTAERLLFELVDGGDRFDW